MRTGAAAGCPRKWLARENSTVLTIMGTGSVGQGTLATCDTSSTGRTSASGAGRRRRSTVSSRAKAPKYPHLKLTGTTDVRTAVDGADVIVTGTTHAAGSSTMHG